MTMLSRQGVILELARRGPLPSQDELRLELGKRGFKVTQATLSRDIRRLGLVKLPQGYALPEQAGNGNGTRPLSPRLERLFRDFVREVREAQNLLVVKTSTGSAQPVAVAWDAENWREVVGTVAGDDTILVICPDQKAARKLAARLRGMLA
jgi:transcriptional regulator of arginine metabolism